MALSVSAAVSSSFDTNVAQRLVWLETILSSINPKDPEITDVVPRIMEVLSQRLQGAYMQIADQDSSTPAHSNPVLRRIAALVRRANELKALAV